MERRRRYSQEFKRGAVEQAQTSGVTIQQVVEELGINPRLLSRWRQQYLKGDKKASPVRLKRDEVLKPDIGRVFGKNFRVYGARKVWKQLNREDLRVARCTVERLMQSLGLRGVARGKKFRTTLPDELADRRPDRVSRRFTVSRPNALWVADLTDGVPSLRRCLEGRCRSMSMSGMQRIDKGGRKIQCRLAAMSEREPKRR